MKNNFYGQLQDTIDEMLSRCGSTNFDVFQSLGSELNEESCKSLPCPPTHMTDVLPKLNF